MNPLRIIVIIGLTVLAMLAARRWVGEPLNFLPLTEVTGKVRGMY